MRLSWYLASYMGVGTCDEEGAAVEVPEQ
jgi:hypothetical protein